MSKTLVLRGVVAALLSATAAIAVAQGSSSGTPTSDAADRGSGSATGKSSNDAASGTHRGHKNGKHKKSTHSNTNQNMDAKGAMQPPAKGSGNADTNAPGTNRPSTQP